MRVFVIIACLFHATIAAPSPQFVTFKDGKVGVNFGGYTADAGLGGLLTGNAAHGGLSASAGTPWGPKAAAGIGGNVDGETSGLAYAGAEANPSVGASSLLAGSAGKSYAGSEAHSNGNVVSKTVTKEYRPVVYAPVVSQTTIQKVKPPKKYSLIKTEVPINPTIVHSKSVVKTLHTPSLALPPPPPPPSFDTHHQVHYKSGAVVNSALNIPIGILRSLQESLGGLSVDKSVYVSKSG